MSNHLLKNDLLLKVLKGEAVERPPVWLMRQAGRMLPEYRKVREEVADFKSLLKNPDLASEVTVQPVSILNVDAAILFSDILVIPEAMGLTYEMVEQTGPVFPEQINSMSQILSLDSGDSAAGRLEYVYQAIKETKRKLEEQVPLIGFSGAPFTLFAYMIEGKGSKTFSRAKSFLYNHPSESHLLLEKITSTIITYLNNKIKTGVDVIQIFDSWAGILDRKYYSEFGLKYIHTIVDSIREVPIIVFSKGAWFSLQDMNDAYDYAIGLDWHVDPGFARSILRASRVLQGNLDPSLLLGPEKVIRQATQQMLNAFGRCHIANLGHGVYPNTQPESAKIFIDEIQQYRYPTGFSSLHGL